MLRVLKYSQALPDGFRRFDVTSRGQYGQYLSPFYLGPVCLPDGSKSIRMENAYQGCKVYEHMLDDNGEPTDEFFDYQRFMFASHKAIRHGQRGKVAYSLFNGEKLSYIEARKQIYIPLYLQALSNNERSMEIVVSTRRAIKNMDIALVDFDGYDHKALGMSFADVVNNADRIMGHSFVLAQAIEDESFLSL
ncbi:DUF6939 family protein [Actinomyces vulturis]|uniref:DUF6939 family protein n=1 Tax=Actinomyces vulturis TaxID=1857645 RepID=UPI00082D9D88|nr:hypothetical protein [Actinomyces vulturis]